MKTITRRDFLRLLGINSMALLVSACLPRLDAKVEEAEDSTANDIQPDLEFNLLSSRDTMEIFPGESTEVWRYTGEVVKGDKSNMTVIENSYLGPIFHVRTGQVVRIYYTNAIPEQSIVHWHGLHVPVEADGHPRLVIDEGDRKSTRLNSSHYS